MKSMTTSKGTVINIDDDGVASVSHPSLKGLTLLGYFCGVKTTGKRGKYTMSPLSIKACQATAEITNRPYSIGAEEMSSGRRVVIALTAAEVKWLEENWPLDDTPTEGEIWASMMPPSAKALREWNDKMEDWQQAFEQAMQDEARSSFAPKRPTDPKPELTPEGKAWLEIDKLTDSHWIDAKMIGDDALKAVIDGSMSLVEAWQDAEKKLSKAVEKHIWD